MVDKDIHVRTVLPAEIARRLGHLAIDLGISKQEILRESVRVLLHHHGMGEGLESPLKAKKPKKV